MCGVGGAPAQLLIRLNHALAAGRTQRHKVAADSADGRAMLSIAQVWSYLIHVPFLGGALVLLALWRLIEGRIGRR